MKIGFMRMCDEETWKDLDYDLTLFVLVHLKGV